MAAPGRRVWLAAIDIAGRRLYLSDADASPVATVATEDYAAGAVLRHDPLLATPTVSWRGIPGGDALGDFDAEIAFLLPADLSLCALWARGQPVHRARIELSVWYEGDAYEARYVQAIGYMEVDSFALAGEQVTGSILAPDPTLADTLPGPDDVVSNANLDPYDVIGGSTIGFSMPDDVVGSGYPFVLGRAGEFVDGDGLATSIPASPALLITQAAANERMLVAARPTVSGATLTIYNASATGLAPVSATFSIEYITDTNGQILSTVDVSAPTGWALDGTEDFYAAGWSDGIAFDNGDVIRGLGDVCFYLISLTNAAAIYDIGRWRGAQAALNTIEVGGYIDQPATAWEIMSEQLLQLYPLCVVLNGPGGLYPAIFEDVAPDDCVELVEGQDFDLPDNERPSYVTDEVYTAIRLQYGLNAATQNYVGAVEIGPQTDEVSEGGAEMSLRGYSWSVGVDGKPTRETRAMQSAWLWLHDSAQKVALQRLALDHERLPAFRMVLLDDIRWKSLPIGLAVRVTSTTYGWSKVPMWVCGQTLSAIDEIEVIARPR